MTDPRRLLSAKKVIVAFFAVLAVLVGGFTLWVRAGEQSAYEDFGRRVEELKAEAASRDAQRPVLRGEAIPGNAWDDYMVALGAAQKSSLSTMAAQNYIQGRLPVDLKAVTDFVDWGTPALDQLRMGTRRTEVRIPFAWSRGFIVLPFYQMPPLTLGMVGLCKSRLLREEGKSREALELLLDLCQFSRDLAQNSTPDAEGYGNWILDCVWLELTELLKPGALSEEGRRLLDRELAVLDGSWPSQAAVFLNQAAALGSGLQGEEIAGELRWRGPETRFARSWRWGFSSRLRMARTFAREESWCRLAGLAEGRPWLEAKGILEDLRREVERWPEPIVRLFDSVPFHTMQHGRLRACRLHLLRLAAHFVATGEVLTLQDPFGGTLHSSADGNRLKAWSVGLNGVDDGGSGSWDAGRKDIVLEVKR